MNLNGCTELTEIRWNTFSGCTNAVVELPANIAGIGEKAFGENSETYCEKVLVPNRTIELLVIASGYPSYKIEMY